MSFTLEFWYYAKAGRLQSGGPVLAKSEAEIERVLADILQQGVQPHPTQVSSPELPTFGILDFPDRMLKMDLDPESTLGALHYSGPDNDSEDREFWSWASVSNEEIVGFPPLLFIDKQNGTLFPPRSVISLATITKALYEFRQTGERPTCIEWQSTGGIA
ncbi:Imm1 family immunity protein [Lentzea sp. NPDC054927]